MSNFVKYPNRRIYDTDGSCYVTVREIAPQLLRGSTVSEHRTQKDVTVDALLCLVRGDAVAQHSGLTPDTLRTFIATYRSAR